MRLTNISYLFISYLILGIICVVILGALFFAGYALIYIKVMKGNRRVELRKVLVYAVLVCYMVIVAGAVLLARGTGFGGVSLQLFRSYKEAWYDASLKEWRNIVLNIAMFIPLGILVPMLSKKLQSFFKTTSVGIGLTLVIEITQILTNRGVFEVDDIFDNTLGTMIGCGIILLYMYLKRETKRKPLKIIGYLSPIMLTVVSFLILLLVYKTQEFGNLSFTYVEKVQVDKVEISSGIDLDGNDKEIMVYKVPIVNRKTAQVFAKQFFAKFNTSIDTTRTDDYEDTLVLYSKDGRLCLWVDYIGKNYWFVDFSYFDDGMVPIDTEEETLREVLQQTFDISIPDSAEWISIGDGSYEFHVPIDTLKDTVIGGTLNCTYYNDGKIKDLHNNLMQLEPVRKKNIISEEEAVTRIKEGKFNLYQKHVHTINITKGGLDYSMDSKGYYQPVYHFMANVDGTEMDINIPALAD